MSATGAPGPPRASWFDADGAPERVDLETCIHCGLCLTACPTYRTLKIEPDSPRGRVYLMRGLAEGRINADDPLVHHLDQCLDCRACETACPAAVPYSRMLESTRGQLERRVRRASPARLLGAWVLDHVLPHRERVSMAADFLRMGQSGAAAALLRSPALRRLLPAFATRGLELTPPIAPREDRALERLARDLPAGARMESRADALVFTPAGAARGRVAFHTSCVMEPMFPVTHREAVRLLVLCGVEVHVPRAQTCCGALHAHGGRRDKARQLARENVRAFAGNFDFAVSHSAGCGAALRETGHLLDGETAAEAFAARVRDVSEVIAHFGLPEPSAPLHAPGDPAAPLRVTYHDACHLAHAQRVREAPRRLLRALPGVQFAELPDSDWCCGSAGVYNLTHPRMADAQLELKLDAIDRVAPHVVVASNPGCLLHMQRGARARGREFSLAHLVDVLGAAYPPQARQAPHA